MITLPRPHPTPVVLEGRYARLEPLSLAHAAGLRKASSEAQRFDYLPDPPPRDVAEVNAWIEKILKNKDYLFSAVIDRASGEATGRQALFAWME